MFTIFQLEQQCLTFNHFLSINHIRIKTYIQKTHVKLNVNNESDNSKKFQKFQFKKNRSEVLLHNLKIVSEDCSIQRKFRTILRFSRKLNNQEETRF